MLAWAIDPLPDFLADQTLTGEDSSAERLREVVGRWVQWVGNLWGLRGRASFAIRFVAADGQIRIYFLANPLDSAESTGLAEEISVLLRSHRLIRVGVAPLATDHWDERQFADFTELVEIRQHETRVLWDLPRGSARDGEIEDLLRSEPDGGQRPRVVYPWWAPGGPFLSLMESLISQPSRACLTIYLEPTTLAPAELKWLSAMARIAQSESDRQFHAPGTKAANRVIDPAAALAGRLYIANLRRLSANPFLVTVHAGAPAGRAEVAASVANTFQALAHERPFDQPQQDDERLPSAASTHRVLGAESDDPRDQAIRRQFDRLNFERGLRADELWRLPYLADARGAALAFRLPVSVRGGVPGIAVRQLPPDFHPGPRRFTRRRDELLLGDYEAGGLATIPVAHLRRHVLITGFTGSGKTVTALRILHQLWEDHRVPFLVLESAKQEYRGLLGVPQFRNDLRVYTAGNEACAPIRLNPFQLLPGVRVEAHVGKLQTCFEGAIPPIGPSSSVIAEALVQVYEMAGWVLTDVFDEKIAGGRPLPTLTDFVRAVEAVIDQRGYEGEVRSNVLAAITGRLRPMLIGGKGWMFDTQRSFPAAEDLFSRPTVLELNDLNLDDKALVVMFLLTMLREYRERNAAEADELLHVTLVEEAHNVLENVASKSGGEGAGADTRFKAVEAFSQMLAEIRSYGEGIIIADQSPEKLARDALRNTNLQIAHQLRDRHDREAIASAMIMEREQRDFLGKLAQGRAAVFHAGLEKATFVRIPPYHDETSTSSNLGDGFARSMPDRDVVARMDELEPMLRSIRKSPLPFPGCERCRTPCEHRDLVLPSVRHERTRERMRDWIATHFDQPTPDVERLWSALAAIGLDSLASTGAPENPDAAWCWFVQAWSRHGWGELPSNSFIHEQFLRHFSQRPNASLKF